MKYVHGSPSLCDIVIYPRVYFTLQNYFTDNDVIFTVALEPVIQLFHMPLIPNAAHKSIHEETTVCGPMLEYLRCPLPQEISK